MDPILVVNAGSSSVKFQLFQAANGGPARRLVKGQIEGIGTRPRLEAKDCASLTMVSSDLSPAESSRKISRRFGCAIASKTSIACWTLA